MRQTLALSLTMMPVTSWRGPVSGDDVAELLEKSAVLSVDAVHAAHGHVVGVSGVGDAVFPGQPVDVAVHIAAHDVGKDRRGGGALRKDILREVVALHRDGAQYGYVPCHLGLDPEVLEGVPDHPGCDAGEEVLEVRVEHVVLPDMGLGVGSDAAPGGEAVHHLWCFVQRAEED